MRILLLLLCAITLLSCKKEISRVSTIQFGHDVGLDVSYYHREVSGSYFIPDHYDIDIDGDGVFDLRLVSTSVYSDILGFSSDAHIESLHSGCQIHIEKIPDTTFIHHSTMLTTNQNNEPIAIQSTTYSCEREVPTSQVYEAGSQFVLVPMSKGGRISREDSFRAEKLFFLSPDEATFEATGEVNQGVAYYTFVSHLRRCLSYPQDSFKYIGLKINSADGTRLGWLKLRVKGGKNITVNSWAIQK